MISVCPLPAAFLKMVLLLAPAFAGPALGQEAGQVDSLKPAAIETTNVPPIPPGLSGRLRQYGNVRSAEFQGWAPDARGGVLIQTRFGDTAQLHRVYEPGGRREQITFYDEPASGRFIPRSEDGSLLVVMSQGGNEQYQIHRRDGATGRAALLTDGESRNLLGPVSEDGDRMIIASNRRNQRDTDLYLADTRVPGWTRMILETDGEYWQAEDLSQDGARLLINHYVSINETYPAVLELATGARTAIPVPGDGPAAFGPMKFSRDGRYAFVGSDAGGEFRQLAAVDLASMKYIWLTPHIPWDVEAIEVGPAGNRVAFVINENGASRLYWFEARQVEVDGQQELAVSPASAIELPLGVVSGLEFTRDGRRLGFTLAQASTPDEASSYDFDGRQVERWTYSEVGGLDPAQFIEPQAIAYPTFDTVGVRSDRAAAGGGTDRQPRMIPAYYFRPRQASATNPAPVLINIHGGPEGQYRPTLSSFDQFLLNEMGIAVIRPNVRGSEGYGKTYLRLDNAERRENSVRDIGALLDWVAQQPELDARRVAVMGGSYGGYMVLSSLVHFSDRLKAGVDIVGIASFQTFLENTSAYRQDLRRAEYGDERDPRMQQVFARIDPLHNAGRITSALFVAHGKNDPRVPFSEAEQIADKVRANGQAVWTVYAANEGHGFAKKANRDYLYAAIAQFLGERLIGNGAGAGLGAR